MEKNELIRAEAEIGGCLFPLQLASGSFTDHLFRNGEMKLQLHFRDHEYWTRLEEPADTSGCRMVSSFRPNDITYFAGWNAVSIALEEHDITPHEVAWIGRFEEDAAAVLRNGEPEITAVFRLTE